MEVQSESTLLVFSECAPPGGWAIGKAHGLHTERILQSLEGFTGNAITDEALALAVKAHNENRRVMRDLYLLRRTSPPLISGVEMMKVLVAAMSLPVKESSELIEKVTEEVKEQKKAA